MDDHMSTAPAGTASALDAETKREIIDLARRIARERIEPRALAIAHSHEFPQDIFDLFKEAGFFSLLYPSQWGGLGADLRTYCDLVEVIATTCSTSASLLISQVFGGLPILGAGNDEQREAYLPKIAAGDFRCAMAMTEPSGGS